MHGSTGRGGLARRARKPGRGFENPGQQRPAVAIERLRVRLVDGNAQKPMPPLPPCRWNPVRVRQGPAQPRSKTNPGGRRGQTARGLMAGRAPAALIRPEQGCEGFENPKSVVGPRYGSTRSCRCRRECPVRRAIEAHVGRMTSRQGSGAMPRPAAGDDRVRHEHDRGESVPQAKHRKGDSNAAAGSSGVGCSGQRSTDQRTLKGTKPHERCPGRLSRILCLDPRRVLGNTGRPR